MLLKQQLQLPNKIRSDIHLLDVKRLSSKFLLPAYSRCSNQSWVNSWRGIKPGGINFSPNYTSFNNSVKAQMIILLFPASEAVLRFPPSARAKGHLDLWREKTQHRPRLGGNEARDHLLQTSSANENVNRVQNRRCLPRPLRQCLLWNFK